MTVDGIGLYEAADLAERAAAGRQWPVGGEPADHQLVGALQFVADGLRQAGGQLGAKPPPATGVNLLRSAVSSAVSTGVWAAAVVLGLVVVPDPAVPWRFAAVVTVAALVAVAAQGVLWQWRLARAGAAGAAPFADQCARIRTRLDRVGARLDPDQDAKHAAAAASIEGARHNLDLAEHLASRQPGKTAEPGNR